MRKMIYEQILDFHYEKSGGLKGKKYQGGSQSVMSEILGSEKTHEAEKEVSKEEKLVPNDDRAPEISEDVTEPGK